MRRSQEAIYQCSPYAIVESEIVHHSLAFGMQFDGFAEVLLLNTTAYVLADKWTDDIVIYDERGACWVHGIGDYIWH